MQIIEENLFKYDWDEWTDGKTRKATQFVDFNCSPVSFRSALKQHARRHGLEVVTRVEGCFVTFRFIPRGEGGE